jgi:hypothetical protein
MQDKIDALAKELANNKELAMPEGLSPLGQEVWYKVVTLMTETVGTLPDTGGWQTFYSPEEWKERGEKYGIDSELIVVYDGGDVGLFFNMDHEGPPAWYDEMCELATGAIGMEHATGWYSYFYKDTWSAEELEAYSNGQRISS